MRKENHALNVQLSDCKQSNRKLKEMLSEQKQKHITDLEMHAYQAKKKRLVNLICKSKPT